MQPPSEWDSADLDAILELERSRGYQLLAARVTEELERQRGELERPADDQVTNMARGQVKALRLMLTIPGILKGEIKTSLRE